MRSIRALGPPATTSAAGHGPAPWRFGWRVWCTFAAGALLILALLDPRLPLNRPVFRFLFVIDITQSMNARDYRVPNLPADRLGFVKAALRRVLPDLPCGSEVGLGLFTTKHTEILFEPIEVCAHSALIADVLSHVDWRMAWAADSYIADGLFNALRQIRERDPKLRLVFLTDGQPTPAHTRRANFLGKPGEVDGLIIGVGGNRPVLIPRLDRENREQGYWELADFQNPEPLPADRDAPADPVAGPSDPARFYRSWLHEAELRQLAAVTGLQYHRLQTPEVLSGALRSKSLASPHRVSTDIRWLLALSALGLFLLPYLLRWD